MARRRTKAVPPAPEPAKKVYRATRNPEPRNYFPKDLWGTILFGLVIGVSSGFVGAIGSKLGEAFIKSAGRTVDENTPEDFRVPKELKE